MNENDLVPASAAVPSPARLRAGQPVIMLDRRRREHYDVLEADRVSHVRGDRIPHAALIGGADGMRYETGKGNVYRVFAATMVQHALNMRRHATIVYPKDIGPLLVWGDVSPGDFVVEGGFGSGALSMALLRAIGPSGRLITYELQPTAVNTARRNVAVMMGGAPANHEVRVGDIYAGIDAVGVDRVVLDVPEPWQVVPHAASCLRDGGMLAAYVPTTLQLQAFALAVQQHPAFVTTECLEVLLRGWHVTEESVRPDQQMVGHTGFLAFSRRGARSHSMAGKVESRSELGDEMAVKGESGDANV